jgi:plastocyanin
VALHLGDVNGAELFKGEVFPGVATRVYNVPALDAGSYAFVCTVHPTMTGTLTVE